MKLIFLHIILFVLITSCKKSIERECFKGHGDQTEIEISLDSTNAFILNKKIKYRIFEDTLRKLVVKGGENMLGLIDVQTVDYQTTITNNSNCNFLRGSDRFVEVEIHYPVYDYFKMFTSDSVIFENIIYSPNLYIELFESGSSLAIELDNNSIELIVSRGTADYTLSGHSNTSIIKVQDNGFANASNFTSNSMFAYQASTAHLNLNLEGCTAYVLIEGSGDVNYTGTPDSLLVAGSGSGQLIEF